MDLRNRTVALYGRFSAGARERLQREIIAAGGRVARDLTRRSDLLVVGALASLLIDGGALLARLRTARARGVPVFGERGFAAALAGEPDHGPATAPLAVALGGGPITREDAEVLAAFDLIALSGEACRFGDASVIRMAGELVAAGRTLAETVRILIRIRDLAPRGRHRLVLTPSGEAALQWSDGLTTLEGQGVLPLDEDHATLDDLFEAAALAEAAGDLVTAARLYDLCARADRKDATAPYNLGNIRLAEGDTPQAILAYQRALTRDPDFVEARYNLAQALEAAGRPEAAGVELDRLLAVEPDHADALFNRAQLRMGAGEVGAAKSLFERYLALAPPADWAEIARKAIRYCEAQGSA